MKKKSKNYKALPYGKFFLLLMFSLTIVDGIFAQCTDVTSSGCTTCRDNVNVDQTCISCYAAPNLTDLKNTGIGLTATVTINATGFANVTNVKVESINIYDNNMPCALVPGGTFATSALFNSAGFGITITDGESQATLVATTIHSSLVGFRINFIVNVYNGNTIIASRNYFSTIASTAYIVGDPHITTVDGVHYDFQAVGEFILLREGSGENFEIQTRTTPVATSGPGNDPYSGLTTCVSLNTAVAVRVGKHRVSYQPNINGQPDPSGMQLRVDGKLTELDENGINLEMGGRVMKSPASEGAIEIDFPDGTSLVVSPNWWDHYSVWYLNINVYNTAATKGIMGVMATNNATPDIVTTHFSAKTKSWLPALPDGSSLGSMPSDMHDRFVQLYTTFADAWRVTDQTSLFDYAPGTSTATFTDKNWPAENAQSCPVPNQTPLTPIGLAEAQQLCQDIVDPNLKANAIFDVMITGEPAFAKAYLLTQQIQASATATTLNDNKDTTKYGEAITFTSTVVRKFSPNKDILTGSVEFMVDGKKLEQVNLDADGRAILTTSSLEVGEHKIIARYIPDAASKVFSSSSFEITHTVIGGGIIDTLLHQWWLWLIILIVIIIIYLVSKKKKP